jgi:hypothetical protein
MTEPTPAQRAVGDFAPKLVELTDNVLFGDVWASATAASSPSRAWSPREVSNNSSGT